MRQYVDKRHPLNGALMLSSVQWQAFTKEQGKTILNRFSEVHKFPSQLKSIRLIYIDIRIYYYWANNTLRLREYI